MDKTGSMQKQINGQTRSKLLKTLRAVQWRNKRFDPGLGRRKDFFQGEGAKVVKFRFYASTLKKQPFFVDNL